MSAPTDPITTQVPDAPAERRDARLAATLGALALIVLSLVATRITEHGFQARMTLELSDLVFGSVNGITLDLLNSLGRAGTIGALLVFEKIPGLSISALSLVNVVSSALFIWGIAWRLDRQGWPSIQIALLVMALLLHPLFLRAATSGEIVLLLSALAFFVLVYTCERLEHIGDVQSQINIGLALGVLVLVDPQAIYLIMPLLPLLPLLYRQIQDITSGLAALLIVIMPPLAGLGTFAYLHILFSQAPLSTAFQLWASPLHGSGARIDDYDWLMHFGGKLIAPLGMLMIGALVSVPGHMVVIWRLFAARAERNRPGAALAALLLPAIAGAFATYQMHTQSAWPYLLAALMALLVWLTTKPLPNYVRRRALTLMLIGSLSAWMYPPLWAERDAAAWRAALITQIVQPAAWPAHTSGWFAPRHVTEPLRGFVP